MNSREDPLLRFEVRLVETGTHNFLLTSEKEYRLDTRKIS